MTKEELQKEMGKLEAERTEALQKGWQSQADLLERKFYMAKAYTLEPGDFAPGMYQVTGETGEFVLAYLNGIMAWGKFAHSKEEVSFPISMLKRVR